MANIVDIQSQGTNRYNSAAPENTAQVSTTQSVLFGFDGSNTDTGAGCYIQVFDSATTPAASAVPVINIAVPPRSLTTGAGNFSYSSPFYGQQFIKGIFIGASSADGVFTVLSSSKILFHVQYAHEDGSGNL